MKRILAIVLLIMLSQAATAATLRVPSQYTEIQAAIDASANGDTILVGPGMYHGAVGNYIIGKAVHILSERGPTVTSINNWAELPGWGSGCNAFDIESAPGPCTISGFTMWGHTQGDMASNAYTIRVQDSDVRIVGNQFLSNYQLSVLDIRGSSSAIVEYNLFSGNQASSVVVGDGSSATIRRNTFSGNKWYEHIRVWGSTSHAIIRNNIIVNGLCLQPPPYCDAHGVQVDGPPENVVFECNDVWNNPSGNYTGTLSDQTGINGNISVDPAFCGAVGSGNFYLQSGSPCTAQNVPGACSGQGMGCFPASCTIAVKRQSWGSIKSLFDNQKK